MLSVLPLVWSCEYPRWDGSRSFVTPPLPSPPSPLPTPPLPFLPLRLLLPCRAAKRRGGVGISGPLADLAEWINGTTLEKREVMPFLRAAAFVYVPFW